jgi:hypothetical protein
MLHAGGQEKLLNPDLTQYWRTRLNLLISFHLQVYTRYLHSSTVEAGLWRCEYVEPFLQARYRLQECRRQWSGVQLTRFAFM